VKTPIIIPTVIAKDVSALKKQLAQYKGLVDEIQLDIMDGTFVKNTSNWFPLLLPKTFHYQAHLMIQEPESWVYHYGAQVQTIILNAERAHHIKKIQKYLHKKNHKIGLALNPETPITRLKPYLKKIDLVLLLTVHPGKYGASFLPETLDKVRALRKIYKGTIELDGGMTPETIKQGWNAGANVFAVGSYLQKSTNKKKALKELTNAITSSVICDGNVCHMQP